MKAETKKEIIGIVTYVVGFIAGLSIGQWISNAFFAGAGIPMFITYLIVMILFMIVRHMIVKRIN